jgi:hypothetical protein
VAKIDSQASRVTVFADDEPMEQFYRPAAASTARAKMPQEISSERSAARRLAEQVSGDPNPEEDGFLRARRRVPCSARSHSHQPWGRIAAAAAAAVFAIGALVLLAIGIRNFFRDDPRFRIGSSSSIQIMGNSQVTRPELLSVFGSDLGRNIFFIPLAARRAALEQLPWVEHATVMRLLPDQLRVAIVERTPVAFVRHGNTIGLVDAHGVLLHLPPAAMAAKHYSFPVVTGISAKDPLSVRAARMRLYQQFISDLDSGGDQSFHPAQRSRHLRSRRCLGPVAGPGLRHPGALWRFRFPGPLPQLPAASARVAATVSASGLGRYALREPGGARYDPASTGRGWGRWFQPATHPGLCRETRPAPRREPVQIQSGQNRPTGGKSEGQNGQRMSQKSEDLLTVLDAGSSKIRVLVAELHEGALRYRAHSVVNAEGMRKGLISDLLPASKAFNQAATEAEQMAKAVIANCVVGLGGPHVRGVNSQGGISLGNRLREITREDVRAAVDRARSVSLPADREILHLLPQQFILDEQPGIHDPVGMVGNRLEVNLHISTCSASAAQSVITCANKAGLEVTDTVFEAIAAAEATVSADERELGACLIDIGAASTELVVFFEGAVAHTAVVPIGGDHFTNDLAVGLHMSVQEAEAIKWTTGIAS